MSWDREDAAVIFQCFSYYIMHLFRNVHRYKYSRLKNEELLMPQFVVSRKVGLLIWIRVTHSQTVSLESTHTPFRNDKAKRMSRKNRAEIPKRTRILLQNDGKYCTGCPINFWCLCLIADIQEFVTSFQLFFISSLLLLFQCLHLITSISTVECSYWQVNKTLCKCLLKSEWTFWSRFQTRMGIIGFLIYKWISWNEVHFEICRWPLMKWVRLLWQTRRKIKASV